MTFLPTPQGYVTHLESTFCGQFLQVCVANDVLSQAEPTPPTAADLALVKRIITHLDELLQTAHQVLREHFPQGVPIVESAVIWLYVLLREEEGQNRWTLALTHRATTNIEFDDLSYLEVWTDSDLD